MRFDFTVLPSSDKEAMQRVYAIMYNLSCQRIGPLHDDDLLAAREAVKALRYLMSATHTEIKTRPPYPDTF